MQINDLLPWAIGGAGLLIVYHFLTHQQTAPELANAGNTLDFPDFPRMAAEPHLGEVDGMSPPVEWSHPYQHPRIPKYVYGGGDYYSNTAPIDLKDYYGSDQRWYDINDPPLLIKVSQNQPNEDTYSHHHFYFDQKPGGEATPIENGIFKNIV